MRTSRWRRSKTSKAGSFRAGRQSCQTPTCCPPVRERISETLFGRSATIAEMDFEQNLPFELRRPVGGDVLSLTWTADIGPAASVGRVADHLHDLQTALDLGERWGLAYAERSAAYALWSEISRRGPAAIQRKVNDWPGLGGPDIPEEAFFDPESWPYRRRPGWYGADPDDVVGLLSSVEVPRLLGSPMQATHIEYNNPVEVMLLGAGFVLLGGVKVLRMIRDWSSQKRIGEAVADAAEAAARQANTAADLGEWLAAEAKHGRQHVPIGELLRAVTPADLAALSRLADSDVQLQLPSQLTEQQ